MKLCEDENRKLKHKGKWKNVRAVIVVIGTLSMSPETVLCMLASDDRLG